MIDKHPLGMDDGSGDATMPLKPSGGGITLPDKQRLVFGRVHVDLIKGNPCIVDGARLLILATELRTNPNSFSSLQDVQALARSALRDYGDRLANTGLKTGQADQAHKIMCALIDDIALSGPWAGKSSWRQNNLSAEFHGDRLKSDFVFELARDLAAHPEQSRHVAELVYVVLAIGFEGPFRTDPRGPILLTQHREQLLRALRARKSSAAAQQSVSWGGGEKSRAPSFVNPVTLAGSVVVIAVGVVSAVIWWQGGQDTQVSRVTANTSMILPNQSNERLSDRVRVLLSAEVDTGMAIIAETDDAVIVRLPQKVLGKNVGGGSKVLPDAMGPHLSSAVALSKGTTFVVGFAPGKSKMQPTKQLVENVRRELRDLLGQKANVINLTLIAGDTGGGSEGPELDPDFLHIVVPKNSPPPSSFTRQDYQPTWF